MDILWQIFLERYDKLIIILFCLLMPFTRHPVCRLIIFSYFLYFINDYLLYGFEYYVGEFVRHTFILIACYILINKGRGDTPLLLYSLLYLFIILHYLLGLFVIVSDHELNLLALPLNTMEIMVFMYGFYTKNNYNSTPSR